MFGQYYVGALRQIGLIDQTAPVITSIPANVTVSCSAAVPAPNVGAVVATDNCTGALTITSNDVTTPGSCANRFTVARTYTVTDVCGNSSSQVQTIIINDQTGPVINCPNNITVSTPVGACTAIVNFNVTATDNCIGNVTIQTLPVSGSSFPIGTTTVTTTATDMCGNASFCSFNVTVIDSQLPVVTTQPVSKTVCANDNVTFSIVATKTLGYRWQKLVNNTFVDIPGAITPSLTLNQVTTNMNNNIYRVNVKGLCSTVSSTNVTLSVNPLPTVTLVLLRNRI